MKALVFGIALVLIGCAGQPVDKKAQYEIAYINVLEFYKAELQKCFDVNDVYIPTCAISEDTMANRVRLDSAYNLAMSHETIDACSVSQIVAEIAVLVKFDETGSLNISGFCSGGEVDAILAGGE